jgi:hypothetical protein
MGEIKLSVRMDQPVFLHVGCGPKHQDRTPFAKKIGEKFVSILIKLFNPMWWER